HPSAWPVTRALDCLASHPEDQPFFLNVSFARPHSPYVPPRDYFELYDPAEMPEPARAEWDHIHDDPVTAKNLTAWRGRLADRDIRRARCGYYGEISFIDAQIGRLTNWLHRFRPDFYRNTWFVFASDHGDMQGDHNLWRKTYAYEGSARIPFILVPPLSSARPARPVADEVIELRDVMPTLLEAAGIPIPKTVDGQSLLPLLQAPAPDWRTYIHGEHCTCYSPEQEIQYVTDGRRKFIWLPRLNLEQFFDLEADPSENTDLIDTPDRQNEIREWRARLAQELEARDCGWAKDGTLLPPPDEPLVSSWKEKRWTGE
ncbi:sulfatase-like hydrolase/transferase, partial [bacterium]|nr:sulfatase-like hydrolase/transferase [bacterium]